MRAFMLALLVLALVPASTSAQDPISTPLPATDGALYAALSAADWFLAAHGRQPCTPLTVFDYDEVGPKAGHVAARGAVGGCTVWFERGYVRSERATMREDPVSGLAGLCYVAIHERLHNLGYNHGPAMWAAMAGAERFCRRWASRVLHLTLRQRQARYASAMKRIKHPQQPKVRSHIARAAWDATGGGLHGGSRREQRRRERAIAKRDLRSIRQEV